MPETRPVHIVDGLGDGAPDGLVDPVRTREAHLGLGRVHVDIHLVEGDADEERRQGELALHEPLEIALEQGVLHHAVPDVPVVDEDENAARRLAVDPGARDPAADRDLLQAQADGVQLAPVAGAEHLHDAVERVGGGGPVFHDAPVVGEPELDLRPGERHAGDDVGDVGHLGRDGLEKLAPGGRVEEELRHRHHGARRGPGFGGADELAALDDDLGARVGGGLPGHQGKPGDRGDARQRLAPEAQRADAEQVLVGCDLARGVALDGQQRVVPQHAGAVVGDPDHRLPALLDVDQDARGPGVERVFHQLLHHRRRPLHHLAGRDFVR